jgi:hypothetical protein
MLLECWARRVMRPCSPPPVDGDVVMEALGIVPGPLLGDVLREVRLALGGWRGDDRVRAAGVARQRLRVLGGLQSG